ncbi:MAG: endonuclease/exonuclease/phosphatase family protein [Gammaproteobacteria bacterium]|nr:endonuclease/exonuclease/phosphatase family protein [Gammaproteobacteria bacterium]
MDSQILKVMSYNIQVGISTRTPHHYLTHSWKHVLPHSQRIANLDRVARLLGDFDLVGLQEVDAGSLRSNYINLAEYLAHKAGFPFWYHQVNRNIGHFAKHSNGLLSRFQPVEINDIPLPGLIPGRNAIMARYGTGEESLGVFMLHLALSRRARMRQLAMISEQVNEFRHVILMGDMNCRTGSPEMKLLFKRTRLREPLEETFTFPSWRPSHHIDHILVTPELKVQAVHALQHAYSDHLPIVMELVLPKSIQMIRVAA